MNEHVKIALLIALQTISDEDARDIILGEMDLADDYVMSDVLHAVLHELRNEDDDEYSYGFTWYKTGSRRRFERLFRTLVVGVDEDDLLMLMVENSIRHWNTIVDDILGVWEDNSDYQEVLISSGDKKGHLNIEKMGKLSTSSSNSNKKELLKFYKKVIEIFNRHATFEFLTLKQILERKEKLPQ